MRCSIVRTHPYKSRVGHPRACLVYEARSKTQEHRPFGFAQGKQECLCHRLFDGADGEAGDEAVEKKVVEEGDRKAGDQAGGHEGAPVVDVAAD